jgi:hypothetical protein
MSSRAVVWSLAAVAVSILTAMLLVKDDPARKHQKMVAAGALTLGFLVFWIYQKSIEQNGGSSDSESSTNRNRNNSSANNIKAKNTAPLKNVWEVGKSKGDANKAKSHEDKPFGSKYYYAHNNPNATGGYKDGLKTEDYRMNGPRLLSRNGSSVDVGNEVETSKEQHALQDNTESTSTPVSSNVKISTHDPNVRNITKYLWDDPGDTNGIATIRIDVLPDKQPGEFIDWKDVEPDDVQASLVGEGLLVKISLANDPNNVKYQLKIPKLYGDVADVKCVIKTKRLLIKIRKKKNSFLSMNKKSNNLEPWPQPHHKI